MANAETAQRNSKERDVHFPLSSFTDSRQLDQSGVKVGNNANEPDAE